MHLLDLDLVCVCVAGVGTNGAQPDLLIPRGALQGLLYLPQHGLRGDSALPQPALSALLLRRRRLHEGATTAHQGNHRQELHQLHAVRTLLINLRYVYICVAMETNDSSVICLSVCLSVCLRSADTVVCTAYWCIADRHSAIPILLPSPKQPPPTLLPQR